MANSAIPLVEFRARGLVWLGLPSLPLLIVRHVDTDSRYEQRAKHRCVTSHSRHNARHVVTFWWRPPTRIGRSWSLIAKAPMAGRISCIDITSRSQLPHDVRAHSARNRLSRSIRHGRRISQLIGKFQAPEKDQPRGRSEPRLRCVPKDVP